MMRKLQAAIYLTRLLFLYLGNIPDFILLKKFLREVAMFVSVIKSRMMKLGGMALFLFFAFSQISVAADHTLNYTMQEHFWTYGCTPTATSMVLGYWDDHYYYGRLKDFYYDNDCGNGGHAFRNVPNTIDELRDCMGTDWNLTTCTGSGVTLWGNINPGIDCATDSRNGYSFGYGQCTATGGSWCWNEMKAEIDAGRPFVWSTAIVGSGHSVAAWGYRDDGYIILYDTWAPGGREDWYYRWYCGNSSNPITYVQQERVWPGGFDDTQLEIDDPVGGESLLSNHPYTIWWYQWGSTIDNVDIYYSTNRGINWTAIAGYVASASGWNSYTWWVPNFNYTNTARVRVYGWDGNAPYIAGDGSLGNFTISKPTCASLSYPTTKWQRVWYIHSSGICLGNSPDETSLQFDNNWSTGTVSHGRSDDIRFASSRSVYFSKAGVYRFTVGSDDGVRLWIDGSLKINQWIDRAYTTNAVDVYLNAGYHNFRLDYYEKGSGARVSFAYTPLPDLVILSFTTNPVTPQVGQSVNVQATIKNQGIGAATNSFYLELYKNRATAPSPHQSGDSRCRINSLSAGATTTCSGTFSYSAAGTYKLWSQVDSWLEVSESNENNNIHGPVNLTVIPGTLPCECDLNTDGGCDMLDYFIFGQDWGRMDCNDPRVDCECDLNTDGGCDMLDYFIFGQDWGRMDCP